MLGLQNIFGKAATPTAAEQARLEWESTYRALFNAVKKNNLPAIKSMFEKHGRKMFGWQNRHGLTPLHFAVYKKKMPALLCLLDLGASLNDTCHYSDPRYSMLDVKVSLTALEYAGHKGYKDFAWALLERGASTHFTAGSAVKNSIHAMALQADDIRRQYRERIEKQKQEAESQPAPPVEIKKPKSPLQSAITPPAPPAPSTTALLQRIERLEEQLQQAQNRIAALENGAAIDKPQFRNGKPPAI